MKSRQAKEIVLKRSDGYGKSGCWLWYGRRNSIGI